MTSSSPRLAPRPASDPPPTDRDVYDAVVVGGSWGGLAAALQLARARRRVLVLDAGRPRNRFAPASHGFLGQDGRAPGAILADARAELLAYPTAAVRADEAVAAGGALDAFTVTLASGDTVRARRLVLAHGLVDELAELPGLAERWGTTVLHCPYCHGYEVADRRLGVLAVGEGNLHQALLLPDWSASVTLFTNGAVDPDATARAHLAARGVRVEPRRVVALEGDAPPAGAVPTLTGVRLADGAVVPLDALFTAARPRLPGPLAEQLGCAVDEGPAGPVVRADPTRATTVPGVFAAGDVANGMSNATLAAAAGVMAGVSAHRSLALAAAGA